MNKIITLFIVANIIRVMLSLSDKVYIYCYKFCLALNKKLTHEKTKISAVSSYNFIHYTYLTALNSLNFYCRNTVNY